MTNFHRCCAPVVLRTDCISVHIVHCRRRDQRIVRCYAANSVEMRSALLLAISVAAIAVGLTVFWQQQSKPSEAARSSPAPPGAPQSSAQQAQDLPALESVPRIRWRPDWDIGHLMTTGLTAAESPTGRAQPPQPMILTNTAASLWPASSLWSPAYLTQKVDKLPNVHVSQQSRFLYYDKTNPLASSPDFGWEQPYASKRNMTTKQFFATLAALESATTSAAGAAGSAKDHLYYSGSLAAEGRALTTVVQEA